MKSEKSLVRKGILDLKPYIPGKPIEEVKRELGLKEVVKLASNETSIGPSPLAVEAIKKEVENINLQELQLQMQFGSSKHSWEKRSKRNFFLCKKPM